MLSFLHSPTLTSIHDHWKNHYPVLTKLLHWKICFKFENLKNLNYYFPSLLPHPNTRHLKGSVESLYHNKLRFVLQKGSFRDISGSQLLTLDYEFLKGFPGDASGKEPACQWCRCRICGFNLWVRKIPWRRKWQPALVFLPGKFHGQRSLAGSNGISKIQTWSRDWAHIHTTLGKLIYYWIKRVTLG